MIDYIKRIYETSFSDVAALRMLQRNCEWLDRRSQMNEDDVKDFLNTVNTHADERVERSKGRYVESGSILEDN